jgi:hypothetical protein
MKIIIRTIIKILNLLYGYFIAFSFFHICEILGKILSSPNSAAIFRQNSKKYEEEYLSKIIKKNFYFYIVKVFGRHMVFPSIIAYQRSDGKMVSRRTSSKRSLPF